MSIEAMSWVYLLDGEVRPPARLVSTMLALADHASPSGMGSSPKIRHLGLFTKLSPSELSETLLSIEALGLAVWAGTDRFGENEWWLPVGAMSVDEIAEFVETTITELATGTRRRRDVPDPTPDSVRAAWRDATAAMGTVPLPAPTRAKATPKTRCKAQEEPERNLAPDVVELCDYFARCLAESGCRERNVTMKWRNDMRLLINDVTRLVEANDPATAPDQRRRVAVDAIRETIKATFNDAFWYANVQSPQKLREKYEALKSLKSQRRRNGNGNGNGNGCQWRTATGPIPAHGPADAMFADMDKA